MIFVIIGAILGGIGAWFFVCNNPYTELIESVLCFSLGSALGGIISVLLTVMILPEPRYNQQSEYYHLKNIPQEGLRVVWLSNGGNYHRGWYVTKNQSTFKKPLWINESKVDTTYQFPRLKVTTYTQTPSSFWYTLGYLMYENNVKYFLHAPPYLLNGMYKPPIEPIN